MRARSAGSHAERALRIGRTTGKGDLFPLVVLMTVYVKGDQVDVRPSDALSLAVRTSVPILIEEQLLDKHGLGELTLVEKIEQQATKNGLEIPPGEWKSLSVELVLALQVMRWTAALNREPSAGHPCRQPSRCRARPADCKRASHTNAAHDL